MWHWIIQTIQLCVKILKKNFFFFFAQPFCFYWFSIMMKNSKWKWKWKRKWNIFYSFKNSYNGASLSSIAIGYDSYGASGRLTKFAFVELIVDRRLAKPLRGQSLLTIVSVQRINQLDYVTVLLQQLQLKGYVISYNIYCKQL